jgi:hypothetical protein
LFVNHVPTREAFHGVGEHLATIALEEGYNEEPVRMVVDRNGRAVFKVFRFQRTPGAPTNASALDSAHSLALDTEPEQ